MDTLKLDLLFCDGVIFAEGKPVRVFGEGDRAVTIKMCGAAATAAPESGRWCAELPAMNAGGPYVLEVSDGVTEITVQNVYVGRVYLVAGQSNAELQLKDSSEPEDNYTDDALLRNFFVPRPWLVNDPFDPGRGWLCTKKETVGAWSAIAYLSGRRMRRLTDKPVGVISCSKGASVIESWLPRDDAKEFELDKEKLMADHFDPEYSEWNRRGVIYEKMLSPLFPFSLNGVIWYQGESDTSRDEGEIYDRELLRFMKAVRAGVRDDTLPFAIIQIADLDWRLEADPDNWIAIQSAQQRAVNADGRAALIVSRDVCEKNLIHPTRKTEISERAADALYKLQKT